MNKKVLKITALIIFIFACLGAVIAIGIKICSNNSGEAVQAGNKIKIVTTVYPEYDWAKQVVKGCDNVELIWLLNNGVDLHNYQPSVKDMKTMTDCDLLIYVGGPSDEWIDDLVANARNKSMKTINLLDVLKEQVKIEEEVEGMQEEKVPEEEEEFDEHVWLSLKNAEIVVSKISDVLCEIDSDNASCYKENAKAYNKQLDELDSRYSKMVASAKKDTILVADRFPFRYLVDDYRLKYYAAFAGCSAETEASFETIIGLAKKVDKNNLDSILITEDQGNELGAAIVSCTKDKNQNILVLDSMQAVGKKDVKAGKNYLNIMESNLKVLENALN